MKVLVLTDSLGLPRESPEKCNFEKTWPQLLSVKFKIHQSSLGGGTINDIIRQAEYHRFFYPDITILQSGIVDCAPRALKREELSLLTRIPFFGKILLNIVKKHVISIRKFRKVTYTNEIEFLKALKKLKNILNETKFIIIPILPSSINYEKNVPGITKRIERYNELLTEVFGDSVIQIANISKSGIMTDNIHLNQHGHNYIFSKVMEKLEKC